MIALLLTLALQDPDLDALIRRLGDPSVDARSRAVDDLERRGPAAVPTLQKALEDPDLEVRDRAREILYRLEPTRILETLLKARKPFGEAGPDPEQTFGSVAALPGGRFTFSRLWWMHQWKVDGTVINTNWHSLTAGSELRWDIVAVTSGCEIPFRRCPHHSPGKIFIDADCSDAVRVHIRGTRRSYCEVPVTFRFPKYGDVRRVGSYTVTVAWPFLELAARDDAPALAKAEDQPLKCRIRPGMQFILPLPAAEKSPPVEPVIFLLAPGEPEPKRWCGCTTPPGFSTQGGDARGLRNVRLSAGPWKRASLEIVDEISLKFRYPVEEPFEVTSPPLN